MKLKKIGFLGLISILVIGGGIGCQSKDEHLQVDTPSSHKPEAVAPEEEEVKWEDWLYFREDTKNTLVRMALGRQKEERVAEHISQWLLEEDQLLYTTKEDWESLDTSTEPLTIINELLIANLDGSEAKLLAGKESTLDVATPYEGRQSYLRYGPLGVVDHWVYFNVTIGLSGTDASQSTIFRMHSNGEDLEEVCKLKSNDTVYSFGVIGETVYFTSGYMQDNYDLTLYQVDLETKISQVLTERGVLLGKYEEALYYEATTGDNGFNSYQINKIVSGQSQNHIEKVTSIDHTSDTLYFNLQEHNIYIGRKIFNEGYGEFVKYNEVYDLKKKETRVSLPDEQGFPGGGASTKVISTKGTATYYLQYLNEWNWLSDLKVVDTSTNTETVLKKEIIEPKLIRLQVQNNQ